MIFDEQIKQQKKIADTILHKLEIIDPHCILAGGAPRDWLLGKPAKDLDFYFCSNNPAYTVNTQLSRVGIEPTGGRDTTELETLYKTMKNLTRIIYCSIENSSIQIQLMQMKTKTFGVLDDFACNMSKAWYKHSKVHVEQDFLLGYKAKAIILNEGYKEDDPYIKKIKSYFPDYRVMNRAQAEKALICNVLRETYTELHKVC